MTKNKIDYSKSTIYKIVCNNDEIKEFYIGSTTNFKRRVYDHRCNCNSIKSPNYNRYIYRFIRNNGGINNWKIIKIEHYECDTKEKLLRRERYYIETLKPLLNKNIPTRTDKEYLEDNKEIIKKKRKIYKELNKEKIKEKNKLYRTINKEKIKERNKDKIKEKIRCECGSIFNRFSKQRHNRTLKHINYFNNL
jgi:hypothetical protein